AIERVRGEEGVLLLTDMFGGTPSNLGMTFLEKDRLEVITGVNLPMLIKLAGLRKSSDLLAVAKEMREHGRNAIWVASDFLRGEHELRRLEDSRIRSRDQLVEIRARVAKRRPEIASLFDAQLLMLDDAMLVPRAADIVREQRVNAEWAVQQVSHEFSAVFDEVADPYLRERKGDVLDLVGRLRMNLNQGVATARELLRELDESSILIA